MTQPIVATPATGTGLTAQPTRADLKQAARQFEAIFLRQMIGSMRQANLGDDLFGSDAANQFRDMQDARMADQMVEKGGFGIAQLLERQFGATLPPEAVAPAAKAEGEAQ